MRQSTNNAFRKIEQGLHEAIAFAEGKALDARVYSPKDVNVRAVRSKAGLSQRAFAATFGIGLGTLRHWERGDRTPKGAALVLLNIIEKKPSLVLQVLHES